MPFVFLHDMQIKWHWDIIRSTLRVSLTDPLPGSKRAMQNCTVPGNGGRGEEEVPPHSQWSFFPQSQWSQLHTVEFAPFRLTSPLTKFLPLAVIRGSPLGAGCALPFGKDSRAHRGRNSRLAHRARQDSASFRLRRQPTGLTFGSLPATSIVADGLARTLQPSACFG